MARIEVLPSEVGAMVVDFAFKRSPAFRVVSVRWNGPWKESKIRSELEQLARWAAQKHYRTGRWFFFEPGSKRFEVCIEVKGKARGEGRIHTRTLPASRIASVTFDPDVVSPRVVYHGVTDWLRWRRKEKEIKGVGAYREVYQGNPWTDRKAWSHTEIQVVVR
ncbi:MAG: GyrI-like domain-containing protein [Thermoplasmata archaeon]